MSLTRGSRSREIKKKKKKNRIEGKILQYTFFPFLKIPNALIHSGAIEIPNVRGEKKPKVSREG